MLCGGSVGKDAASFIKTSFDRISAVYKTFSSISSYFLMHKLLQHLFGKRKKGHLF